MKHEMKPRLSSVQEEDFVHSKTTEPKETFFEEHEVSSTSITNAVVEDDLGPEMRIVTGAYKVGKVPDSCEDAFFITERGFGVADGVSGWNDYGFSSSAFSTSLMQNC